MFRTMRVLAIAALPAAALAQMKDMKCADMMKDSGGKMACCDKMQPSKEAIKARLSAVKKELKLSDGKIDKIADALATDAPDQKCRDKMKDTEKPGCCN